jgi:hypothetical protein
MSLRVRPASYSEILNAPNAEALLAEYAAECSIPGIGRINPQAEMYAAMEAAGFFRVMGAFDGDRLRGFAAVLTYLNPHYGLNLATVESLFLGAEYRNSRGGIELMGASEEHAEERNCETILYSAPTGSQFETLLSLRKNYHRTHSVFMRSLRPPRK